MDFFRLTGVIATIAISSSNNMKTVFQTTETRTGPEDGPNQPVDPANRQDFIYYIKSPRLFFQSASLNNFLTIIQETRSVVLIRSSSRDEFPTIISNSPGSTTYFMSML
jgi:hypothetical protein